MKKIIFLLVVIMGIYSTAMAAGSCSFTFDPILSKIRNTTDMLYIKAEFTADAADASFPDTDIPIDLHGWYVFKIVITNGATGPTDDSDFYIRDGRDGVKSANDKDMLNGDGENQVDNSATNDIGLSRYHPINGPVYMDIDNNAVNGAETTVEITLVRQTTYR